MNKSTLRTIETSTPPRKGLLLPMAGALAFGLVLFWCADHILGDCYHTLADVTTYCPVTHIVPTK